MTTFDDIYQPRHFLIAFFNGWNLHSRYAASFPLVETTDIDLAKVNYAVASPNKTLSSIMSDATKSWNGCS